MAYFDLEGQAHGAQGHQTNNRGEIPQEGERSMTNEEFRLKCEAIARGEKVKSCPKAKVKSCPTVKTKSAPKPATWAQAVAYIQRRDKCSAIEAGRKACGEFPELRPTHGRKS